jgi:mRNA interferase RelE/StbE
MLDRLPHWTVILERQPEKLLRRLPRELLQRLDAAIMGLAEDPRPAGCQKLKSYDNLDRVRVGDWRITYAIEDDRLIVLVIEIASRGGAYRDL